MTYIDAYYNQKKNVVRVAEKDSNGNRQLVEYPVEHSFYYTHPSGSHISMYGDTLKKYSTTSIDKFKRELRRIKAETDRSGKTRYKTFESDINPVFRILEEHYKGADTPKLNLAFFDIETGFDEERGFAPPDNPFNPITAISVYLSHMNSLVTLVLCPPTFSYNEAADIASKFENTYLFDNEKELLRTFCSLIYDTDVVSGWNSSLFDVPYIVNRIREIIDDDATRELCLWRQKPRQRIVSKFGRDHEAYDLVGRVHLDYLELYQKHNPQQQHSYRLDYIGEIEVGENKVPYEGTLDDLYKKDFYKFIEYSRQDVALLVKIDQKKKFIELANQIAHVNCVQLKTTMGSVALVEQAIILEMHEMGVIAPDRKPREDLPKKRFRDYAEDNEEEDEEDEKQPVVGAYVAEPRIGLHDHVAAMDINSLYPSTIRALNISPETIVGQVRLDETNELVAKRLIEKDKNGKKINRAQAWDGIFAALEYDHMMARDGAPLTVDFDDGTSKVMSGRQLYDYIFNPANNVCISANGTIFRTDKDGIIPLLLAKWYSQRKSMQAKKNTFTAILNGIDIDPELEKAIRKEVEK